MARETRRETKREERHRAAHDAETDAEREARLEGRPEVDHTEDPDADIELGYEEDLEQRRAMRLRVARVVRREVPADARTTDAELADAAAWTPPRVDAALWFGILGPPMLLLLNQQLNYMLVPWTCRHDAPWLLHVVSLVLIAAIVLTGLVALRLWRGAGGDWESQGEGPLPRSRFMAILGVTSSAFAALILFAQWLPILYITPCRGA